MWKSCGELRRLSFSSVKRRTSVAEISGDDKTAQTNVKTLARETPQADLLHLRPRLRPGRVQLPHVRRRSKASFEQSKGPTRKRARSGTIVGSPSETVGFPLRARDNRFIRFGKSKRRTWSDGVRTQATPLDSASSSTM